MTETETSVVEKLAQANASTMLRELADMSLQSVDSEAVEILSKAVLSMPLLLTLAKHLGHTKEAAARPSPAGVARSVRGLRRALVPARAGAAAPEVAAVTP